MPGQRKRYSAELKAKVALEAMGGNNEALADFNRALALDSSLGWVKQARDNLVCTDATVSVIEVITDDESFLAAREIVTDGESYLATREIYYVEE